MLFEKIEFFTRENQILREENQDLKDLLEHKKSLLGQIVSSKMQSKYSFFQTIITSLQQELKLLAQKYENLAFSYNTLNNKFLFQQQIQKMNAQEHRQQLQRTQELMNTKTLQKLKKLNQIQHNDSSKTKQKLFVHQNYYFWTSEIQIIPALDHTLKLNNLCRNSEKIIQQLKAQLSTKQDQIKALQKINLQLAHNKLFDPHNKQLSEQNKLLLFEQFIEHQASSLNKYKHQLQDLHEIIEPQKTEEDFQTKRLHIGQMKAVINQENELAKDKAMIASLKEKIIVEMLYNNELRNTNSYLKKAVEDLVHRNELILNRLKHAVEIKPAQQPKKKQKKQKQKKIKYQLNIQPPKRKNYHMIINAAKDIYSNRNLQRVLSSDNKLQNKHSNKKSLQI